MNILKTLLEEFFEVLPPLESITQRNIIIPDLKKIKAIIGMRRTGKTYFLYQQIHELLQSGISQEQILYLNFEDDRLTPLDKFQFSTLLENFYSLYPENHNRICYFFLDEIQNVEDWAQVVRRFYDTKKTEIMISGSSAKLLSKEIATSLRGRCYAIEVWPYSFSDYLFKMNQLVTSKVISRITLDRMRVAMINYFNEGGMPELYGASQEERFRIQIIFKIPFKVF